MVRPLVLQPFHPGNLGPGLQAFQNVIQPVFHLGREPFFVSFGFRRKADFDHVSILGWYQPVVKSLARPSPSVADAV
ncbi:MAG: hypothetical protein HYY11_03540 [Candidatus Methylomirabilis oxyfera]|nr:hypothetical protein [Candidatus Methylomirabilis oxyfera]